MTQQTIYDQLNPGPTHGSLFSGYGGIDLALEEVFGARTVWVSDIDPGSCAVLDRRFPEAESLGDITQIPWTDVPPVDILSGGSPCQDLSAAGRRAGMSEGTRSNLWVQMREAIDTLRPRLVVWENVMGALSATATSELEPREGRVGGGSGGPVLRALGRVLGDLAEIGFDAEWATVRASDVGAPHGRARVFLIAWPSGYASPADSLRAGGWRGNDASGQSITGGENVASVVSGGAHGGSQHPAKRRAGGHQPSVIDVVEHTDFGDYAPAIRRWEEATGRLAPAPTKPSPRTGKPQLSPALVEWMMGLPNGWFTDPELGLSRVQQLQLGGNGVVPQQAAYTIGALLERSSMKEAA